MAWDSICYVQFISLIDIILNYQPKVNEILFLTADVADYADFVGWWLAPPKEAWFPIFFSRFSAFFNKNEQKSALAVP